MSRRGIAFVWETFGPYHMDRCEACAHELGDYDITGIEITSRSDVYDWDSTGPGHAFRKVTLFPNAGAAEIGAWRYFRALIAGCLKTGAQHIFLCGFENPAIFLAAIVLRLLGRRVIVMQDSKFDDKPRRLAKECAKALMYSPYHAALVGSPRSKAYLRFLGLARRPIALGYDTVSMSRIARLAGGETAPGGGVAHAERHFTIIARFVAKKNLSMALRAYEVYCRRHSGTPRALHLCGSGELEAELREQTARSGVGNVHFRGYLQEEAVACTLASSLALILPSREEPFGLVVNEALAVGIPVIVSDNCGARDLLVRRAVNGYVIEPDNIEGLARVMHLLDRDAEEWARLAGNSRLFRSLADTAQFAGGVADLVRALPVRRSPEHPVASRGGSAGTGGAALR
jgi:glycosyltransferase involved in cell wall biosynthesis